MCPQRVSFQPTKVEVEPSVGTFSVSCGQWEVMLPSGSSEGICIFLLWDASLRCRFLGPPQLLIHQDPGICTHSVSYTQYLKSSGIYISTGSCYQWTWKRVNIRLGFISRIQRHPGKGGTPKRENSALQASVPPSQELRVAFKAWVSLDYTSGVRSQMGTSLV